MAPSISHTGTGQIPLGYTSTYTWSSVNIGAADAGRLVMAVVYADNANVGGDPTADVCTIGGISATRVHHAKRTSGDNSMAIAVFVAVVPTGTTADVYVEFVDFGYVGSLNVFRCLEVLPSISDSSSYNAGSDSALDTSVTVPSTNNLTMSAVIYQGCASGTNITWNNINEISEGDAYNYSKRVGVSYIVNPTAGSLSLESSISPTQTSEGLILGWVMNGINDYVLDTDTSSFALNGYSSELQKGSKLSSDAGGFSINGQDSNLLADRSLETEEIPYVLTGEEVTFGGDRILLGDSGEYDLTLVDGDLSVDRFLEVNSTVFTLNTFSSELSKTIKLEAETGNFSLSASPTELEAERTLTTITTAYNLTFTDVELQKDIPLSAETGVFTVTGSDIGTAQVRCPTFTLDLTLHVPEFIGQGVVESVYPSELTVIVEKLSPTIETGYNAFVPSYELSLNYGANYYKVGVIATSGNDAPASHIADSKKLDADAYVDLFEITLADKSTRLFFKKDKDGTYQGNTYEGTGIKLEGVAKYADDEVARPKLSLFNPDGVFSSLVDKQLLDSSQITRIRVLKDDFDNDRPVYRRQRWRVSRVASVKKGLIGLELRDMLDGQNFLTPGRMFIPPDFPAVSIS